MSLSPFTKITNIMSTALKDEIAQTKVKLAIAEAKIPSDLNEINILRALLTELLKKENFLLAQDLLSFGRCAHCDFSSLHLHNHSILYITILLMNFWLFLIYCFQTRLNKVGIFVICTNSTPPATKSCDSPTNVLSVSSLLFLHFIYLFCSITANDLFSLFFQLFVL
jgi:hypothetical protein